MGRAVQYCKVSAAVFGLAVAAWFFCSVTVAQAGMLGPSFRLERAYDDLPLKGTAAAKGAVIWNHGRGVQPAAKPDMLPFYLDDLRAAGWDVFRLERDWGHDDLNSSSYALREAVDLLRQKGYSHVVLAGQSYGAWISLMVAKVPGIDTIIATAPAAFGKYPESWVYQRNATELYPVLGQLQNTRVMLFLFRDDPYDPGERGQTAEAILGKSRIDHLVVDAPAGLVGHGAANYRAFANRFGPCITRFVDPARSSRADCATDPVTAGNIPVQLPRDVDVTHLSTLQAQGGSSGEASDSEAGSAGHSALGIWYGSFANGREVVLAIQKFDGQTVDAVYAWGQDVRDEDDAGSVRRRGKVVNSTVSFDEPGIAKLAATPRPDGQLDLRWTSADGATSAKTTLHRLK